MTAEHPSQDLVREDRGASRRAWLLGLAAAVAALGGAGLAWRNEQSENRDAGVEAALWRLSFETLASGTPLRMDTFRGQPLLLNFWATWCPPCVDELPMLSDFYQEHKKAGWQVLGLAVDQAVPVRRFLAKAPVSFPVALAGVAGMEIGKLLGNASGALPFTVVLGSNGRVAHRKIGKISPADLQAWVQSR